MKEIILLKAGEIALKGLNRSTFEDRLVKNCKFRLRDIGSFRFTRAQSTMYAEPLSEDIDMDDAVETLQHVFGFSKLSRACVVEKDMDTICAAAEEYLGRELRKIRTFKVEAKRSDKKFPLKSPEIAAEVGGYLLSRFSNLRVDVHEPDLVIFVEIRDQAAYIHGPQLDGAGGMPVGSSGKAMLLVSGGIDSPVAGYMMAKRGMKVDCLHFHSYPYTNMQAKEKVVELAKVLSSYTGGINLYTVSVTHIQEAIHEKCAPELMITLLRRFMFRIAERQALRIRAQCLITGESLGQVASQTIEGMTSSNSVVEQLPVLRPLVGFDKNEIIDRSVKIGTYDISILPYEDCCTVFLPDYPAIRPKLKDILEEEKKLDVEALITEAFSGLEKEEL